MSEDLPKVSSTLPTSAPPSTRKPRRFLTFRLTSLLILTLLSAVVVKVWLLPAYMSYQRRLLDEDLAALGAQTSVGKDRLLLRGESITDETIADIAPRLHYVPVLRQVDLLDTKVTDSGFTMLTEQNNIVRMHIQSGLISDQAIEAARQKRPDLDAQRRTPDPIATGLAKTNVYRDAIPVAKFSPYDGSLFFGSGDGGLHRHSMNGSVADRAAHENWLFDLEFSPSGQWLATVGGDNRLCIWNPRTMQLLSDCVAGEKDVHGIVWLNETELASAGDDRAIRLWQLRDRGGEFQLEMITTQPEAHQEAIPRIVYDRQNQRLLTASRDNQIRIWAFENGRLTSTGELVAHVDDVMAISLSPDGSQAMSVGYDGNLISWDLEKQCSVRNDHLVDQRLYSLYVDWQNSQAYVGHHAGLIRFDWPTGKRQSIDTQQLVASIVLDDQRSRLATTSADGRIVYRDRLFQPKGHFQYEQLYGFD